MLRRILSAIAFTAVACSDSTAPSGNYGTVSFTFTGAGGGTFEVSGIAPTPGSQPGTTTNVAAAIQDTATSETVVLASRSIGTGLMDVVFVGINRLTVGSASVSGACDPESTSACTGLFFGKGFNGNGDTAAFFCSLSAGTVAITEVTATRVKGTFSGTGECLDPSTNSTPFAVTNGTFSVAVVSGVS